MTEQNTTDTAAQEPENGTQTADETTTTPPVASDAAQGAQDASQDASQGNAETFPREYVEKLRKEAAEARLKAKKADDYAQALFTARVAATGRLADPSDLPFNTDLVDDLPALEAAIDDLLAQHPHYAARTPRGDIGQGITGASGADVDLAAMLRGRA